MIRVGSRVRIIRSTYYGGSEGVVAEIRALRSTGRDIATISLDDSKKMVKFYLHSIEEIPSNCVANALEKERESILAQLTKKEEAQMKLYSVTKVTALKDGGFTIEEKNIVAADQDAAKMKSGLMLTNVDDADYATWYVAGVMDVKTRDAEKK